MTTEPIEFSHPDERDHWLSVYEARVEQGATPKDAAAFADEDMAIRRRVYPLASTGRPSYADLVSWCSALGKELLDLHRSRSFGSHLGLSDPAEKAIGHVTEILGKLNALEPKR